MPQDNLLINNTLKHNIILDEKLIESKYQKIITDLKLDDINSKDFLGEKGLNYQQVKGKEFQLQGLYIEIRKF